MKRIILSFVAMMFCASVVLADEPQNPQKPPKQHSQQKFSPEKFQADMESFIAKEAGLTEAESAKFFPLLREMQQKQRNVYEKMKNECYVKPTDEAGCKRVVQKRDMYELEVKKIQQTYHNKFLTVLPAAKVYDVIKAEDRFHRRAFRNWSKNSRGQSR